MKNYYDDDNDSIFGINYIDSNGNTNDSNKTTVLVLTYFETCYVTVKGIINIDIYTKNYHMFLSYRVSVVNGNYFFQWNYMFDKIFILLKVRTC